MSLNIYRGKTNILKVKTANTAPIMLEGKVVEEVENFTYLDSIIDKQGRTDANVKA